MASEPPTNPLPRTPAEQTRPLTNDPAIRPPAATFVGRLWEGFFAPFAGFKFLNRHSQLWKFAFLPVLINLLLTVAIVAGMVSLLWWLGPKVNAAFDDTFFDWLMLIASWLGLIFAAIASTFILYLISIQVLCAQFFGQLAIEVEVALGMPREDLREISLYLQAIDAVRDILSLLLVMFVCLVLNCVPVIGTVAALAAVWYFDSFIFGRDYLDYPLALRSMRRKEKLAFCRQNRGHTLGLGGSALLMNLVPIIGSIFLATSVVGAVILHRRIELGRNSSTALEPPAT